MTRRRQLSHDCCIDLSPKVFVRRTSLTQIQALISGNKPQIKKEEKIKLENKTGSEESKNAQPNLESKEEADGKEKPGTSNGVLEEPIIPEPITPAQFTDANEIRRAISLSNIWKVKLESFLLLLLSTIIHL
jgi:hypothetical protein